MDKIKLEYEKWINKSIFQEELKKLSEQDITESFLQDLEFGTGGLRGILGPGTNRMNIYTIRKASWGFGKYLSSEFTSNNKSIVIAHDNRHQSKEFALESAKVISSFGIKVYLFSELAPTPLLSYAIRFTHSIGGIVITASHNPKEYNGYKVYDETGCQLSLLKSDKLINIINKIEDIFTLDYQVNEKLIEILNGDVEDSYKNDINNIRINKNLNSKLVTIVYTPLHGAAYKLNKEILTSIGYNLHLVEKQCVPDPDFSATLSANPEEKNAYIEAIKIAQDVNADIVLASDPDGDRIGVVVKHNNEFRYLTGNQTGALLIEYILSCHKKNDVNLSDTIVYNTIVTSSLGAEIAKSFGTNVYSTLTGFKFIGEQIHLSENTNGFKFIFGYEESYGYLISSMVRDKDSIQAATMIAEMTNAYKEKGLTLIDGLNNIYNKYGFYLEDQLTLSLKGIVGLEKIKNIMSYFRSNKIKNIGIHNINIFEDYLNSIRISAKGNEVIKLPKSDVIKLIFEDGSFIAVRPSGTEPKCKIYFGLKSLNQKMVNEKMEEFKNFITISLKPLI